MILETARARQLNDKRAQYCFEVKLCKSIDEYSYIKL